jgi:hypothetical protein
MEDWKKLMRDPEVWIYLIAIVIGLAVLFTPVMRLCGGFFLLASLIMLSIKLINYRKTNRL